ncbi:MAG: PAS domain S-box protein [Opitutales bacterium]|nr:PAS domain S-box protein [Opitutales bacterium]
MARFEELARQSQTVIWELDLDGCFTYASESAAQVFGYHPAELVGKMNFYDLHPEEGRAEARERGLSVIHSGKVIMDAENPKQVKGGRVRWMLTSCLPMRDASGRVIAARSSDKDITEYKLAKDALKHSEERLELVIKGSNDAPWDWDLVRNELYYSPQWWAQIGYPPGGLTADASFWECIMHPNDKAKMEAVFGGALKDGRRSYQVEFRLRHRDGHYVPVLSRGFISRDAAGKPVRVTGTNMDLTERRRAEEEMRAAREQADAANAAKSEFLANMSHEVRTPLNGVIGLTSLLLDTALDAEQRKHTELLRSCSETLLSLVNDILDFSKIEAGKLTLEAIAFDPVAVATDAIAAHRIEADRRGLELTCSVDQGYAPWVTGDPSRFRQILDNLVGNAIKFTPAGRVAVRLQARASEDAPEPGSVDLNLSVEDTGIGIHSEKIDRLFEKFSQVDVSDTRHYGGTGLGLAISKQLSELMGGTISVKSEVGGGSCFSFSVRLPEATEPTPSEVKANRLASPPPAFSGGATHVLVVEDNATNRRVVCGLLKNLGLKVSTSNNGEAAVRQAAETRFDLILMDLQMPRMNGLEATRALRTASAGKTPPTVPIIGLTARAMEQDRAECLKAGMNDHLPKPLRMDAILVFT